MMMLMMQVINQLTFHKCLGRRIARCSFGRVPVDDDEEDDEAEREEHVPVAKECKRENCTEEDTRTLR